jgi:uncharacterized membrane protein YgcG
VRFHTVSDGVSELMAAVIFHSPTQDIYFFHQAGIHSALDVDVTVDAGTPTLPSEGQPGVGAIGLNSAGINAAQNVAITLDVAAPLQITRASIPGAWACTLVSAQQARCTIGVMPSGMQYLSYEFRSDTAAKSQATVTVAADRDSNPSNDTKIFSLEVLPLIDVAVGPRLAQQQVVKGSDKDVAFTVTTGPRPVPGVHLYARSNAPLFDVAAMSAAGAPCQVESFGMSCYLGDLPANATVAATVRFRALSEGTISGGTVYVTTARDSETSNDVASITIETYDVTDLRLDLAATSAAAQNGGTLTFPRISVVNGSHFAANVVVTIPLPTFVSVLNVSSTGTCTGTTKLECNLGLIGPNQTESIDLTLTTTATGTFTSDVAVAALNDSPASNNAGSVRLSVTSGSSGGGGSGGSGSSGGGGGGRMEWLALALLALLVARRQRQRIGARQAIPQS